MNFTENNSIAFLFINVLQIWYIPVLAIFGITGNIICALVFTQKSLRRICSSSFLLLLALNDVLFLVDLLPGWIHTNMARSLFQANKFICQIQTYVGFVSSFVHTSMVLAFTAERCFAVNFPLKHMSRCTRKLCRTIIAVIVLPVCLFYVHPSFFATQVDPTGQCREKETHVSYLNQINTIDTILTMFVPFVVVLVLNLLIIRKLFCSTVFGKYVFDNGSSFQYRISPNFTAQRQSRRYSVESTTASIRQKHKIQYRHVISEFRLTKMLLAISLTCLLLNFPSYYSRLMAFYEKTKSNSKQKDDDSQEMIYGEILYHYMSYLSYAINIFIYLLFGVNFRRALRRMFLSRRKLSTTNIDSSRELSSLHQNSFYLYRSRRSIT